MSSVATPKAKRVSKPKAAKAVAKQESAVEEPKPVVEEPKPVVEEPESSEGSSDSLDEPAANNFELQLNEARALIDELSKDLKEKLKDLKTIDNNLRSIGLLHKKELKSRPKRANKDKSKKQSNHGFQAEVSISDELAAFFNVKKGTKMRRPEVTKLINAYANEHNLKDEKNRTIFLPDEKLKNLFGPPVLPIKSTPKDKLVDGKPVQEYPLGYSIFNFQSYMKRHFIKEQTA
jgi:chromatin remodeling complex protein RSC6